MLPFQCGFKKGTKKSHQAFLLERERRHTPTSSATFLAPPRMMVSVSGLYQKQQVGKMRTLSPGKVPKPDGGFLVLLGLQLFHREEKHKSASAAVSELPAESPPAGRRGDGE